MRYVETEEEKKSWLIWDGTVLTHKKKSKREIRDSASFAVLPGGA